MWNIGARKAAKDPGNAGAIIAETLRGMSEACETFEDGIAAIESVSRTKAASVEVAGQNTMGSSAPSVAQSPVGPQPSPADPNPPPRSHRSSSLPTRAPQLPSIAAEPLSLLGDSQAHPTPAVLVGEGSGSQDRGSPPLRMLGSGKLGEEMPVGQQGSAESGKAKEPLFSRTPSRAQFDSGASAIEEFQAQTSSTSSTPRQGTPRQRLLKFLSPET